MCFDSSTNIDALKKCSALGHSVSRPLKKSSALGHSVSRHSYVLLSMFIVPGLRFLFGLISLILELPGTGTLDPTEP